MLISVRPAVSCCFAGNQWSAGTTCAGTDQTLKHSNALICTYVNGGSLWARNKLEARSVAGILHFTSKCLYSVTFLHCIGTKGMHVMLYGGLQMAAGTPACGLVSYNECLPISFFSPLTWVYSTCTYMYRAKRGCSPRTVRVLSTVIC
jgi:hypothetical protein